MFRWRLQTDEDASSSNGFFMNWYGNQKGEGFEYYVLAAAMALVIKGGGKWSLDRALSGRRPGMGALSGSTYSFSQHHSFV